MANVSVLRLDLAGGLAPGNKVFKLQGNISAARHAGYQRLLSFGGAWSNHLHALAAVGAELGLETVGLVRGERPRALSASLLEMQDWGMQLHFVSRDEYRRWQQPERQAELQQQFGPCWIIPEGAANRAGVLGCRAIGAQLNALAVPGSRVVLAVGTGTTLAGIVAGLDAGFEVTGVAALRGATDLEQRVANSLELCATPDPGTWSILHDFHCGGFARSNAGLQEFIHAFESAQKIPLEPVYTAKAMFAVWQLLRQGSWHSTRDIAVVHTGGLQGRRGFNWLRDPPARHHR